MRLAISILLVVAALIHLPPLLGMLGSDWLARLYGLSIEEPNLAILMRHRAVLLGLVGLFLLAAAFHRPWQWPALMVGLVSVVSFLWLAWSVGGYNPLLARVFTMDLIALACLLGAMAALAWVQRQG